MAKNVMKLLKPSPNLGKNGFDLSHRTLFSANMGELLPCCCIETVPDDDVRIRPADLICAAPMVTSPFMRVKQHIDFWFVPYQNLWHRWNDFITSRSEPDSSALKKFAFIPQSNLKLFKSSIAGSTAVDVHGSNANFIKGAYRLLDLLGYPTVDKYFTGAPLTIYDDVSVNWFRLAAYQNIWYHEYRQKYYDDGLLGFYQPAPGVNDNPACLFNFDYCTCDAVSNSNIESQSVQYSLSHSIVDYISQLRYRCWKKDLFTGLLPSTQFGAVSTVSFNGLTGSDYQRWLNYDGTSAATNSNVSTNSVGTSLASSSQTLKHDHKYDGFFDILTLRKSEALQIWRENALRAGNQIQDNYRAHYGVEPDSHMNQHPIYIGSYDAPLNISDVEATAATGTTDPNSNVGDIAGKGISSLNGDRELRFKTNDFGVVMGIFSLLPEAEYNSTGVDRPNQLLEQFDFFMPEMENLGLEAVTRRSFSILNPDYVAGYAPRYYAYKQKLDLAHLDFMNTPFTGVSGVFRQWASPKSDADTFGTGVPLSSLYVKPSIFDVNFVASATLTAQFLVDMYFDITAVRPMSVTGMPGK